MIQTSGETLLAIINDILDMSNLEAGRFKMQNRPFEPRTLVREVGDLLNAHAQTKRLCLDVEVASEVPQWLQRDGIRMTQVLTNVVGTALDWGWPCASIWSTRWVARSTCAARCTTARSSPCVYRRSWRRLLRRAKARQRPRRAAATFATADP